MAERLRELFSGQQQIAKVLTRAPRVFKAAHMESTNCHWTICFRSTVLTWVRQVLEILIDGSSAEIKFIQGSRPYSKYCRQCLGMGMHIPDAATSPHQSNAGLGAVLLGSKFEVKGEPLDRILPKPLQQIEWDLFKAMDKFRGDGLFDYFARGIEETLLKIQTKHILDYNFFAVSIHAFSNKPVLATHLCDLGPIGRHSVEIGGVSKIFSSIDETLAAQGSGWGNASKKYSRPCSSCAGSGLE